MNTIAFVDDEQGILDGLRRKLRKYQKTWDMKFFSSGQELLDDFSVCQFDVVVSDMRMPVMTGNELLMQVKEISPQTLRIALSGYSNEEMTLESLHATHQFIAKPADSDRLATIIKRAMTLRDTVNSDSLHETLGSIESLPVLPDIYDELMSEIASGNGSIDRIGEIIESDLALSSNILKIVNSAYFNLTRHIESPQQAATILGIETIKNIALSTSVLSSFDADRKTLEKMSQVNINSQKLGLLVSNLARELDALSTRAKDHSQIAAMMTGLGELMTLHYGDLLAESPVDVSNTCLLGSYVLAFWGMPYPVVEAVMWYQSPKESGIVELGPITLVHAAWSMLACCSERGNVDPNSDFINYDYLESIVGADILERWVYIIESYWNNTKENDD